MRKSDDEKSGFAETVAYYMYLAYTVSLCLDTCKTRLKLKKPFKLSVGAQYDASKQMAPSEQNCYPGCQEIIRISVQYL